MASEKLLIYLPKSSFTYFFDIKIKTRQTTAGEIFNLKKKQNHNKFLEYRPRPPFTQ